VVIVDPFMRDRGDDVATNFLKWYQDEVKERFSHLDLCQALDTSKWKKISATTDNTCNHIYTPLQIDGYSCGALSAMMAYYYIMYGRLPTRQDFTCAPAHVKEIRLFMAFEIARLQGLPEMYSAGEQRLHLNADNRRKDLRARRKVANRTLEANRTAESRANEHETHLYDGLNDLATAYNTSLISLISPPCSP
jgi:hypothetical protein